MLGNNFTVQQRAANQIFFSPPDPSPRSPHHPPEEVDVGELVARIQEHVHTNRIRVSEHFQDFDPLRSGSISATRFRQSQV